MDFELFKLLDGEDWQKLGADVEMHDHFDFDECETKMFQDFMVSFDNLDEEDLAMIPEEGSVNSLLDGAPEAIFERPGIPDANRSGSSDSQRHRGAKRRAFGNKLRDCRWAYVDAMLNAVSTLDEKLVRAVFSELLVPDVVWMTCWLNDPRAYTRHRYREFRGRETAIDFALKTFTAAPDGVVSVKERKVFSHPDGSSLLVVKVAFDGSILFDMALTHIVRRTQHFLSRFNPFAAFVPSTHHNHNHSGSESVSPLPSSSTATTTHDTSSSSDDDTQAMATSNQRKRKQAERPTRTGFQIFDQRALSRDRKVAPDQIEVGTAQSRFMLGKARKQPARISVTGTGVLHINRDFQIFKVETFKRVETNFFR